MLDINFIRQNQSAVEHSASAKGYQINLPEILKLDDARKTLLAEVETTRQARNQLAQTLKSKSPTPAQIKQGKTLKSKLAKLETEFDALVRNFQNKLRAIPNIILDDVPLGGEEGSVEIKRWGENKSSGVDHLNYATGRDWLDFARGAKVAGTKFYFLKNELALLENALIQFGIAKILEHNFTFMTVPDLVSSQILEGTGFNPRASAQSDEYFIENEDLTLIATAELPLTGYHMNEILEEKNLPLFYAGLSACFRKEAGAYGKFTRGLFRVHQFNKLEMYAFCLPEQSPAIHERLLSIEEEIWQALKIPYRIINIAAGDLGAPAAKKYDIEYWSPVDQTYRELTSCSNCTDFQARNLNIRVRRASGEIVVAHTLNGTAISLARALVALLENYADPDGKLTVPEPLRPYLNNRDQL